MQRKIAFCLLWLYCAASLADTTQTFNDAKSFASGKTQGVFNNVTSGAAQDKVPKYGTNPQETQYFQGGQGQLSGPGIGKMQSCATYTPGPDKVANQECEAVNFLARNPQIRPQFNIDKNDPMFLAAKHARDNAESFFQSLGINGGAGNSTQCTTKNETTPAQYTTETCSSLKEVGEQQCTMGRVVNIDADSNFQCDQTVNAYETLKCRRSNNVSYTLNQNCTDGYRYTASGIRDNIEPVDMVLLTYMCNSTQATGPLTIGSQAHGSRWGKCDQNYRDFQVDFSRVTDASTPGAVAFYLTTTTSTVFGYTRTTTTWESTPPSNAPNEPATYWVRGPDMSPDWQGYCQPMKSMYRVTKACSALNPNCEIQMYWWQENCSLQNVCTGWGDYSSCSDQMVCATYRSDTLTMDFLHPSQFVQSISFVDGCAALEARAQ
jgi:hypothetical protein